MTKLIVGLGNPGDKYIGTRHNIGFYILEDLFADVERKGNAFTSWKFDKKFNANISKGEINGQKIILAMPQTFMNNSGETVKALLEFFKITPENLTVIHDDKDIKLGEFKIHRDRGAAGHNGVISIMTNIGTSDFNRIRVGVKNDEEQGKMTTEKFVLGKFSRDEMVILENLIVKEILPTLI